MGTGGPEINGSIASNLAIILADVVADNVVLKRAGTFELIETVTSPIVVMRIVVLQGGIDAATIEIKTATV